MDQLNNLLEHLDIHDNFDILGHAWGGEFREDYPIFVISLARDSYRLSQFLAGFYAATRPHKPEGLQTRSLIVSNAYASMELLEEGLNTLNLYLKASP